MIVLYVFGPNFGLPDTSPFCTKADMLLKLAKLPYRADKGGFRKAPKGKQPYIEDDGVVVADSTFIRDHIEKKYGIDFDQGLSPAQRGTAWAVEKMCEDHLYWAVVRERWMDDANFAKGPAVFFASIPAPIRPLIIAMIRQKVRRNLKGHGFGRHSPEESADLARRDLDALAAVLGDKPYLMGNEPHGADATVFAFVAGALCPHFDTATRRSAESHANLVAYRDRLMRQYYPDLAAG